MITSGKHLGVVRRWMQRKFNNGDRVTWGSCEFLSGTSITVREMEQLAEDIKSAVLSEVTNDQD